MKKGRACTEKEIKETRKLRYFYYIIFIRETVKARREVYKLRDRSFRIFTLEAMAAQQE
jgi:uncharacterized protein YnzC (UPF0291/DUF896 family)